jgi:hypothetical protein
MFLGTTEDQLVRKVQCHGLNPNGSRLAPEENPSCDSHDNEYGRCNGREAQHFPLLEILAKVREFACARRTGSEMINPGLRFLKGEFAGGNSFEDVGTRTTAPLGVWVAVKKRAPQHLSKSLFFILG